MSYTAPTYVDTKEQAILALASTIADSDKTLLGDGSVNKALDVLADVLAEHDVSVPQTDAGAILALAQYVGGGGGIDIGEPGYVTYAAYPAPTVGQGIALPNGGGSDIKMLMYDGSIVAETRNGDIYCIASGLTCRSIDLAIIGESASGCIVSAEYDEVHSTYVCATVEAFTGNVEVITDEETGDMYYQFVMPDGLTYDPSTSEGTFFVPVVNVGD